MCFVQGGCVCPGGGSVSIACLYIYFLIICTHTGKFPRNYTWNNSVCEVLRWNIFTWCTCWVLDFALMIVINSMIELVKLRLKSWLQMLSEWSRETHLEKLKRFPFFCLIIIFLISLWIPEKKAKTPQMYKIPSTVLLRSS